jgi:rare lipoprotein A
VNERNERHVLPRRSFRKLAGFSSIVLTATLALSAVPLEASARGNQVGTASWYGPGFHGKKTASGKRFNQHALTAAHRSLPLGTKARVTNLKNGKAVLVTINDRGPYHGGRVIDLSRAAAHRLAMNTSGTARVSIVAMR